MLHRASFLLWISLNLVSSAFFLAREGAHGVLRRSRRANTGFLEELKPGNIERECIEEVCNYEEAREAFENDDLTRQFWLTYHTQDPCQANACRNNGTCVPAVGSYTCLCPEGFEGLHCDIEYKDSLKCLYQNGGCQHFCESSGTGSKCSCSAGYSLGVDGKQCVPQVDFPCGLVPENQNQTIRPETRLVGGDHCSKGDCPWQVLVRLRGAPHCGGVLVHAEWVVTAAHCVQDLNHQDLTVVAGEHNLNVQEGTEQILPVMAAIVHWGYSPTTADSDVALLRLLQPATLGRHAVPLCLPQAAFARNELMHVRYHSVLGWGWGTIGGLTLGSATTANIRPISPVLRSMQVPLIENARCTQYSRFNFTERMLCAGYLGGLQGACTGDDGSPLVTRYGSTSFLLGVVGWGKGCPMPGYYGVYANMEHFVDWVQETMRDTPNAKLAGLTQAILG